MSSRRLITLALGVLVAGATLVLNNPRTVSHAASPPAGFWIETHTHPLGGPGSATTCFTADCLDRAIAAMDSAKVLKALMSPPPDSKASEEFERQLAQAAMSRPQRFAFLNGGRSLNPMIQDAVRAGQTTPDLQQRFEARTAEIARSGAVGYGELAALHLSFNSAHPYIEAAPDHPLFLALADAAARYRLPLDLHMEAVAQDKPTPPKFRMISPNNPPMLRANIPAFERLLARTREARIIWEHIGWDNTGDLTVTLLRRLLEAHPNLYLQIKVEVIPPAFPQNTPLDDSGKLRAEWLDLIRAFPDRFLLGSDALYGQSDADRARMEKTGGLLSQLPDDLARKVGYENALRVYQKAEPPALDQPPDGSRLAGIGAVLSWVLPPGTTQYQIQILPANNDGPAINLIRSPETSFSVPSPVFGQGNYILLPDMTYSWRVRATDKPAFAPEDDPAWGPWSIQRTFRTALRDSSRITPVAPAPRATLGVGPQTLQWANADRDVFYYEIQVSGDARFDPDPATATSFVYWNLVHGGVTSPLNSWETPPLERNTEYFWRVRPRVQGDGTPVAWSPAFSFRTGP